MFDNHEADMAQDKQEKTISNQLIDNVNVTLEAVIGTASMTVKSLNELTNESLIQLNGNLANHVELRLNGSTIAYGELVAVGDKFGVKIIDIA